VMASVAAIIATEKLWKRGPLLARLVGAVSVVVGIVLVARSI
jgi:predicted metal-binding membrane protein